VRRTIPLIGPEQRRVVFDGALVGEPEQRSAVVAQRIGDLTLRALRPHLHRRHPIRGVLRNVLLHERCLTTQDAHHRQRAVPQLKDHALTDRIEVVNEIAFARPGAIEQLLIEVREPNALSYLVGAHRFIVHPTARGRAAEGHVLAEARLHGTCQRRRHPRQRNRRVAL
jgi:hypothetical protein